MFLGLMLILVIRELRLDLEKRLLKICGGISREVNSLLTNTSQAWEGCKTFVFALIHNSSSRWQQIKVIHFHLMNYLLHK